MNSTVTKEQQRQEAIERLRILEGKGLMSEVRRDFEQGKLNYSERLSIPGLGANGILYWLEGNPELEKVVRDFEESTGSLAYHATHETFEFGEVLDIFCVSKYEEEWEYDRNELKGGRGDFLGPFFKNAKQKLSKAEVSNKRPPPGFATRKGATASAFADYTTAQKALERQILNVLA